MKIKKGFITNSSSANFIITIRTKTDKTIEEFKTMFNRFLDNYKNNHYNESITNLQFWNPNSIIKITDTIFEIYDWVSMYNDYDDIPHYFRYLLLLSIIEPQVLEDILDLKSLTFRNEGD